MISRHFALQIRKFCLPAAMLASMLVIQPIFAMNFNTGSNLGTCVNLNGTQDTCTTAEGITISSTPGNLFTETFRGVTGLGVTGGQNGEVDLGEKLFLTAPKLEVWNSLQFSRLFGIGAGDTGQEFVNVQTGLAFLRGQLIVDPGNTSATWNLFFNNILVSSTAAIALAPFPGAGYFEVFNPFQGIATSALRFDGDNPGFSNDFAFVGATVTPVPEPDSVLLVLAGFAAFGLRRRHSHQ